MYIYLLTFHYLYYPRFEAVRNPDPPHSNWHIDIIVLLHHLTHLWILSSKKIPLRPSPARPWPCWGALCLSTHRMQHHRPPPDGGQEWHWQWPPQPHNHTKSEMSKSVHGMTAAAWLAHQMCSKALCTYSYVHQKWGWETLFNHTHRDAC